MKQNHFLYDKYIYIRIYDELQVPNKSISFRGAPEWFDVDSESLLKDCAPNLSIRDIATRVKSCKDIERKYKDACEFSKKGWLQANGNVSREGLQNQLQGIEGMNKYIDICLDWDGESDYDYYDYYDYWYLEESDDVKKRSHRSVQPSADEMEFKKLVKRESKKPARQRSNRRERGNRKRSFGSKKQEEQEGQRKSKRSRSKVNHQGNGKSSERNKRKRKGNKGKKNKTKKKKKGKNKKKTEKKILRTIGLKKMPTKLDLQKLKCMEKAVNYGLEKCAEKTFRHYVEEKRQKEDQKK